jgi:uncharacterized Zn finger protein
MKNIIQLQESGITNKKNLYCFTCGQKVQAVLWTSQPIRTCPNCGNVLEAGVLQANYEQTVERLNSPVSHARKQQEDMDLQQQLG